MAVHVVHAITVQLPWFLLFFHQSRRWTNRRNWSVAAATLHLLHNGDVLKPLVSLMPLIATTSVGCSHKTANGHWKDLLFVATQLLRHAKSNPFTAGRPARP